MSWFQIDDHLNNSPELLSIPKTHRPQAIGVWTFCGVYVADHLTDGFVPNEIIKQSGAHRNKIRTYLTAAGFWVEAPGGIRMQPLYCRWQSSAEAAQSRYATGRRVANYRARQAQVSGERDASGAQADYEPRTNGHDVNGADVGKPIGVTVLHDVAPGSGIGTGPSNNPSSQERLLRKSGTALTSVDENFADENFAAATSERGLGQPVKVGASRLVSTLVPNGSISNADRTMLRIKASELLSQGESEDDVAECLRLWLANDKLGSAALGCCMAQVYKQRRNGREPSGAEKKMAGWLALGKETE